MLNKVADVVIGSPKLVVSGFVALVLAAGIYGFDVAGRLSPAGYEVGGSESTAAAERLATEFDTGPANLVLLVSTDLPGGVTGREATVEGLALTDRLASLDDIGDVTSYWATGAPQLLSTDGTEALIAARIVADEEQIYSRVDELREEVVDLSGDLQVTIGGSAMANLEMVEESERDLLRAELLAIPLTTIIMLIVFRSVVAALLPLVVSAVAVAGTAALLKGLSEVTLVSIFALNLTTALGLGMGVDFSLFTISRWREERAAGASNEDALRTTVNRAGRSVLFSGMTTAATLAALLLFDYPLLRSLAYAGFVVVMLATAGALLALPATMALLGDHIDRFSIRKGSGAARADRPIEDGRWYRIARWVSARPKATMAVVVLVLLGLGSPFLRAEFAIPDDRALPLASESRQVADELRANFDSAQFGALAAVSIEPIAEADLDRYATSVSVVDGVAQVETSTGVYRGGRLLGPSPAPQRFTPGQGSGAWLSIVPAVEPISSAAAAMVAEIRALPESDRFELGGESARLVDNKAELRSKLLPVLAWVVLVVGFLLYRSFGSLLLPLKAILLNFLSLTAAFGAIVWIFQDGRLTGLLSYTPTGLTDAQTPILILCIAFGLSMDYEVFLLSRIKEEWDRTGDSERAVAVGLQRTGGIITAAAVLMAVVFLSFATGRVAFIQLVGIGLALAILADATLVRTFLVPSFMAVAGRWNWWAPSFGGVAVQAEESQRPVVVEAAAQPEQFERPVVGAAVPAIGRQSGGGES